LLGGRNNEISVLGKKNDCGLEEKAKHFKEKIETG